MKTFIAALDPDHPGLKMLKDLRGRIPSDGSREVFPVQRLRPGTGPE